MNTLLNEVSSQDQLLKTLEDLTFSGDSKEQLQLGEKLSPSQPVSVWIRDFIDSTNPRFKGKTKKERISMALGAYYAAQQNEEYGAGFEGTNALRDKYIKDTPGQRIQQFKTEMKQKTYQEFEAQHKKMYPSHTTDQVKAAWETYSKAFEMEEEKIISYKYDMVIAKLKDGIWDTSYDVKRGKHLEVTDNNTKKTRTIFVEEANDRTVESVYTDLNKMSVIALRGILRQMNHPDFNDIKNQGKEDIIAEILMLKFGEDKALEFLENPDNFKMDEADNNTVREKIATLKKAMEDINDMKATADYNDNYDPQARNYHNKRLKEIPNEINKLRKKMLGVEEAYGESWVVYDPNKKQVKRFETRQGAYDYATKSGGVVYSAEYYADNQTEIKSGKLVKENALQEAKTFVSKGIYTLDGKKIEGARSSKLFLQALDADGFLHDLSWKEWSESDLEDTSSDSAKKQFVDRLTKQIKMFNKRIDLNTFLKSGNINFIDTVNYIFKLDSNIKYSKAAGLKEESLQEGRDFKSFSRENLISWLQTNWTGNKVSPEFRQELDAAVREAQSRGLYSYIKVDKLKEAVTPKVPSKGTYGLKEEKEHYDSWIIKPRDGGEAVKVKAPDETSAIEIALGRKPSQNEIDFFNFHYILIQEKTNVSTLRHMKIVELATKCTDSALVQTFVEQQYKPQTSALEIKESFRSFVSNRKN